MAIEFNCPSCTAVIRVSDEAAGKTGRCPKCEIRLRVPQPAMPPGRPSAASTGPATSTAHKPSAPPDDGFEAVDLEDLKRETSPQAAAGGPDAVTIPEIPDQPATGLEPFIETSESDQPVYRRMARSHQRNWVAILVPLVCGGILVAAGVVYWWTHRETMTGELSGQRLPEGTIVSTVVQRFVPDVSTELWQAALRGLREDPVTVQSGLMLLDMSGSRRGIEVSLSAGPDTDLVRVDVRQNPLLRQFCIDEAHALDEARNSELKAATTRFLLDWDNANRSGMLMGNAREYRDSVGLNALTEGLGYHSVALVGNTLYPCVHEDMDGRLYFVIPRDTEQFMITERTFPDQDSVFPGEYEFTVKVVTRVQESPPESTELPGDDDETIEEGPEEEMPEASQELIEDAVNGEVRFAPRRRRHVGIEPGVTCI